MDEPIVQALGRAHRHVLGEELQRGPCYGGHDGAFMWTHANIPTVVYGIGGASQKDPTMLVDTEDLYIHIEDFYNLAKVLSLCTLEVCNTPKG